MSSAYDALMKFNSKDARKRDREMHPKSKNKKPERVSELAIIKKAESLGFEFTKVESKAVYSAAAGRYLHSQTSESLPDLVGDFYNIAAYCEVKAKGRRSTLKPHQRKFLVRKINRGCFALCADSADYFEHVFNVWWQLAKSNVSEAKRFLLNELPGKKT